MERLERSSLSSPRNLSRRIRILPIVQSPYPRQRGGGVPLFYWIPGRIE
jgi:hypothetical protein